MISLFTPVIDLLIVLTLAEQLWRPARTDWWINVQTWILSLFTAATFQPMFEFSGLPSMVQGADLPFWIGFPAFLVLSDLGEYLFHRAQHRVPLLWAMHSLHHSDPDMSALTAQRHFWAEPLIKRITIWAATSFVIAPTPEIMGAVLMATMWSVVTHSRLRIDFGRWSWLLNAPAYHRRHHSSLPEHYDSNFAALFPIFDVIAGSYHRADGYPPTGFATAPKNLAQLIAWPLYYDRAEAPVRAETEAEAPAHTQLSGA